MSPYLLNPAASPWRPSCRSLVALLIVACGLCLPSVAWSQSPPVEMDFETEIKPIFAARCYECHGQSAQAGGVRFDQRASVAAKGYSQELLLGGTLATNEIYRRVASQDASYRMPKGQPPLTSRELALVRRWVEAGTPWPMEQSVAAAAGQWWNREVWLQYAERWVKEVPGLVAWLSVMLVLQCCLLLVERYKNAARQGKPWTTQRWTRPLAPLRHAGLVHYLFIVTLMGLVLSLQVMSGMRIQQRSLEQSILELRRAMPAASHQSTASVYGSPPIPIRPAHPPRLSGTYYRGNCERSPQLFNGGNYRTATLHLSLIDAQGKVLQPGDRVEPNGLSVRFELERAQGTTEMLFGESIARGVFLTTQSLKETLSPVTSPCVMMRVTKPGWKWEATFPLNGPPDAQTTSLSGLVYVYQGTIEGDRARGSVHYGIKYDLRLQDRTLQPESDLWLGSLFWSPNLETPQQGKVPLKEWFDINPIPEITGQNSTDPKLLGIPEHQKQDTPK